MAVINARSCSLRRSSALRKKSARTVASRLPRDRRTDAFRWAASAAIGHSSGIIGAGLSDFR
jgi:hypothetical protein